MENLGANSDCYQTNSPVNYLVVPYLRDALGGLFAAQPPGNAVPFRCCGVLRLCFGGCVEPPVAAPMRLTLISVHDPQGSLRIGEPTPRIFIMV